MSSAVPAKKLRVLTLGDGNFSFSLALAKKELGKCTITATSFDSEKDLEKFREAPEIIRKLLKRGAEVFHDVDATEITQTLPGAKLLASGGEGDGKAGPAYRQWDVIIFNHPHTGVEDFRRHQALLCHFFASATRHLAPCGEIRVALMNDQPERWKVVEQAARSGLVLKAQEPFRAEEYPGYEHKRHHANRGFRVHCMQQFTFARAADVPSPVVFAPSSSLTSGAGESSPRNASIRPDDFSGRTSRADEKEAAATDGAGAITSGSGGRNRSGERRQGRGVANTAWLAGGKLEGPKCEVCGRVCPTERALKQHCLSLHRPLIEAVVGLPAGPSADGTSEASAPPPSLECTLCSPPRRFASLAAVTAHKNAKHLPIAPTISGSASDLSMGVSALTLEGGTSVGDSKQSTEAKAGWIDGKAKGSTAAALVEMKGKVTEFYCEVCDLSFPSDEAYRDHRTGLQPRAAVLLPCPGCTKTFPDARALKQHLLATAASGKPHLPQS